MNPPSELEERRETFRVLYRANYHLIAGYVLRRTSSVEDAADVVADTFLIAWRRLSDVPADPEARLWLYGVARRVLANHGRSGRRRSRLAARLRDDLANLGEFPETPSPAKREPVAQALAGLREVDREILGLVVWEGLTHEELGRVLGCSTNAAKIRVHRARRRFAEELAVVGIVVNQRRSAGHVGDGRMVIRSRTEEVR